MIKQVFVPLHVSEQETGDLLEFYTRPQLVNPEEIFSGLTGTGLELGIAKAKRIFNKLDIKYGNGIVYCVNSQPPLINPESVALSLLLISQIAQPQATYSKLIVCADIIENDCLSLSETGHWQQKLSAIFRLGKQDNAVPLILPVSHKVLLRSNCHDWLALTGNNVLPYFFSNVGEVLRFILP
ncbi:MAG: hypothetical protein ABL933_03330 [Methyloglobulus sp.]|nr:hypothetical protein [Methyloglobulus sp.]